MVANVGNVGQKQDPYKPLLQAGEGFFKTCFDLVGLGRTGVTTVSEGVEQNTHKATGVITTRTTRVEEFDPQVTRQGEAAFQAKLNEAEEKLYEFVDKLGRFMEEQISSLDIDAVPSGHPINKFIQELAAETGISINDARNVVKGFVAKQKEKSENRKSYEQATREPSPN